MCLPRPRRLNSTDPSLPFPHHTTPTNSDVSLENVMLCRGKFGGGPICRLIDLEMARPGVEEEVGGPSWEEVR